MKLLLVILLSISQTPSTKRVLTIYTKDQSVQIYREQLRLLAADPDGLKERDIVIRTHPGNTGFKIVLTGKDGGEKYTSTKLLSLVKLYAIIDAMPMRKQEMSKR